MTKSPSFGHFQLLFLCSIYLVALGHPVSNPGNFFSGFQVSKFPFYEKLVNPCGFSQELDEGKFDTTTTAVESLDDSAFTEQFLTAMMTSINLTKGNLDKLKDSIKETPDCSGVSLNSLPHTPTLEYMNEFNTMKSIYKSGIYLIAHLHIAILDRETVDDLNQVIDYDSQIDQVYYFLCGTEHRSFVEVVDELTRSFENILCTLLSGANLKQRASFRSQLKQLEATKIFRYHHSCSSMQMRDCVIFLETDNILNNFQNKFGKLLNQYNLRKSRTQRHRSTSTMSTHHLSHYNYI